MPDEALPEEVAGLAARPFVEAVDRLVFARELPLAGRRPPHHARVGVAAAAEGGPLRLLVDRETLDHPGGGEDVREEVGGAPEELAAEAHHAARGLQVHDVGELVGQHQAQPALEVAEVVGPVGGHGADVHERVGQGRGVAVRIVVGVGQDHPHPPHAVAVARLEVVQDVVAEGRGFAGHALEALVIDDGGAPAHEGAEVEVGRNGGRARRGGRRREEDERAEGAGAPGGGSPHSLPRG